MVQLEVIAGTPVTKRRLESSNPCFVLPVALQSPRVKFEIPTELMIMIARYLPKPDWKSLRLVSHDFLNISLDLPLHTEVWFSPYAGGLEAFVGICHEPRLAKYVTSVILDTTAFGGYGGLNDEMTEPQGHGEIDPNTGEWKITRTWTEFNGLDPESDEVVAFKRHIQESSAFEKCQKDLLCKFTTGIKRLPRARSLRLHCGFDRWKNSNSDDLSGKKWLSSPLARTWPINHHFDPFIDPRSQNISTIKSYYFNFAMAAITESRGKLDALDISPNQTPLRALIYLPGMSFSAGRIAFESLTSLKLNTEIYDVSALASEWGFVHLLTAARSLKRLDMSVRLCRVFRSRSVFSSDDDVLAPLFGAHTIEYLKELRLANFTTTTETLCDILGRHRKTLKRLHLQKITEIEDNANWVSEVLEFCRTYLNLDAARIDYLLRDPARDNRRVQVYETNRTAGWGEWDDVAETG